MYVNQIIVTVFQVKVMDPFVIYTGNIAYSSLREMITEAVYGRQVEQLVEATQVIYKG